MLDGKGCPAVGELPRPRAKEPQKGLHRTQPNQTVKPEISHLGPLLLLVQLRLIVEMHFQSRAVSHVLFTFQHGSAPQSASSLPGA